VKDTDGKILEVGDIVWYRINGEYNSFSSIGIVGSPQETPYLTIRTTNRMLVEKLPINVRKMSDEEAMLWQLENV